MPVLEGRFLLDFPKTMRHTIVNANVRPDAFVCITNEGPEELRVKTGSQKLEMLVPGSSTTLQRPPNQELTVEAPFGPASGTFSVHLPE